MPKKTDIKRLFVVAIIFYFSESILSDYLSDTPCGGVYHPKNCENASLDTLGIVEDFERCAPLFQHTLVRDYIWGSAGRSQTYRENIAAYFKIHIRKRVMQGDFNGSLKTTILGNEITFPIGISPTAAQAVVHADGDIATAKGAHSMGTLMVLSSYSNIPLEKVSASVPSGSNIWMQTYIFPNRSDTVHLVRRAEKAGFKALVVTVDASTDTVTRCNVSTAFLFRNLKRGLPNLGHPDNSEVDPHLTFNDLKWLRRLTHLPIVAKGIMTGEDAISALKAGATAIFVSNHGGRQLDGALPTIDILPAIVDEVNKHYPGTEVYVDGGIRNGFDVFKAIARGARVAFIGRPNLWGLTMGGENGVKKVLSILRREFQEAMLHAGFSNPHEITRSSLYPEVPDFYHTRSTVQSPDPISSSSHKTFSCVYRLMTIACFHIMFSIVTKQLHF